MNKIQAEELMQSSPNQAHSIDNITEKVEKPDTDAKKTAWNWYAVKMLLECIIEGEADPAKIDSEYSDWHKTYEETIMLVKARSFDEAYTIAGEKIKEAEIEYKNPYGQAVSWKHIEWLDCFHLFDEDLATGTELYSRYLHVPKEMPTDEVVANFYPETNED